MKLDLLYDEIELITIKPIQDFVIYILYCVPDYFWTLPASTSGRRHGKNETLIEHVKSCMTIAQHVCREQFKNHWGEIECCQLYAALLLHDCWRCGTKECPSRYTEEIVEERGYDPSLVGKLKSLPSHPEIGAREIEDLFIKYKNQIYDDKMITYLDKYIPTIIEAVRYHYGPFSKDTFFPLNLPYDSVIVQTHNIDMHQALSSMYNRDK